MNINSKYNEVALSRFINDQWDKTLGYLRKTFGLSRDDCQDVFQEAVMTLYENINDGTLRELTCSLSTYLMGICNNKAHEMLRRNKRLVDKEQKNLLLTDGSFDNDKVDALIALDDDDTEGDYRQTIVARIVDDLPSPCNELLWGFYRDNLSLKTLAGMLNYSEGSMKVTKHRCVEKFRARYQEMINKLF